MKFLIAFMLIVAIKASFSLPVKEQHRVRITYGIRQLRKFILW
ncbi:uncharacterized protein Dwil_GK28051 [Drosophila willistoni]|uniref:Seminal fluid protein n=1 Tax=Drosophila willistoni TaxID=7260 RepID=A0A0Q9WQ43_DROWI|nr:uncharacterized protein Dwil_GK28051 [Drosophila willistoni]